MISLIGDSFVIVRFMNKRVACILLMVLISVTAFCQEFVIDGIRYKVASENAVGVIKDGGNKYSGNIYLPTYVVYNNDRFYVKSIEPESFYGCKELTSIYIPDSVIIIGDSAFENCYSLSTVRIPQNVKTIGAFAFESCGSLKTITIPDGVTTICSGAFSFCRNLTSITIPSGVTSIGDQAFYWCTSLTSLYIPSSVTTIGYGITTGCASLNSICVSPDNNIYDSRNNCNAIITKADNKLVAGCTSTIIPSNVTIIGKRAFSYFSDIKTLNIPLSEH